MLIYRRRIFNLRGTFLKDPHFYKNLGPEKSLPAICNPVKHGIHRNILNPLFSKRAVAVKYPLVLDKVERAVDFVRRRSQQNAPIEVDLLFQRVAVSCVGCPLFGTRLKPFTDGHSVQDPIRTFFQSY